MGTLKGDVKEVVTATGPIILVVLLMQVFVLGSPLEDVLLFIVTAAMVMAGFAMFLFGVRWGMLPIGEAVGSEMPQRGSLLFVIGVMFIISFLVTIAEPDVRVLASLVESVSEGMFDRNQLMFVIGVGVGFFMVVAALRTLFGVSTKKLLLVGYAIVIALSFFTPDEFLAISFDASGVTTGPMTVPIILSLGVGISAVLSERRDLSNTFGYIGLASIGPIIGVMLMGVFLT